MRPDFRDDFKGFHGSFQAWLRPVDIFRLGARLERL